MSKLAAFVVAFTFAVFVPPAFAQDPDVAAFESLAWSYGPAQGDLGKWATVAVPSGYRFCGAADTKKVMQLMQNPISNTELGFIAPDDMTWFAVFEFSADGYVKDDEKAELDADAILDSIREGTEAGNRERKKRGWPTLEIVGWQTPPHYDESSHNLEWATKARDGEGGLVVNFNTRILGRAGVMSATLVVEPDQLGASLPQFKSMLDGFEYKSGQRYAEYKSGDKLAEYGLTALVAGGAGAIAAKTGLLAKLWKFILVGLAAIGAALKKLFGGGGDKSSRQKNDIVVSSSKSAPAQSVESAPGLAYKPSAQNPEPPKSRTIPLR